MQRTFSISKYYNVKLAFHSIASTFSGVIYCVDILVCWLATLSSSVQCSALEQGREGKTKKVAEVGLEAAAVDNG